ncbi:MAG: hypothetical protein KF752_02450 [Pirellulaceae bacterium]|nr:hypothetical protein [Pirellulaceae bacterium]
MPTEPPQRPNTAELDISSDPPLLGRRSSSTGQSAKPVARQPVRIFFGCCRAYALLTPPQHVLVGKSDLWRAHCPRCGELVEVFFQ